VIDRETTFWITFSIVMLFLAAFLVLLIVLPAHGHDAPHNFTPRPKFIYPPECCSPNDESQICHPVSCEEISLNADGYYTWSGLVFAPGHVHPTQDDQCHACNSTDGGKPVHPYCLFIRNTT
jgi:hypothetical protein